MAGGGQRGVVVGAVGVVGGGAAQARVERRVADIWKRSRKKNKSPMSSHRIHRSTHQSSHQNS